MITGDALATHDQPAPGRIRDALGPLLPPLLAALDTDLIGVRHVPDHPPGQLAAAVRAATDPISDAHPAEVVVVTGSTSVGVTDQLRGLLCDNGARWVVDTVTCRPGHPQLLAEVTDLGWVTGLPGNPYAALVAVHTVLAPLVAGLAARCRCCRRPVDQPGAHRRRTHPAGPGRLGRCHRAHPGRSRRGAAGSGPATS